MSETLRTAFREAAQAAPVIGDPVAARRAAGRRRTSRWAGAAFAVALLTGAVWVGGVQVSDRADKTPSHPVTPSPPARGTLEGLGVPLLVRTCSDTCEVHVLDEDVFDHQVRPGLGKRLVETGLDGVSLSPDGLFVAYPRDGALVVTAVYRQELKTTTIRVPAGPAGSQWKPYYWTQGKQALLIAQWTAGSVTALGVVHVGYSTNPEPQVFTRHVPGAAHLVPTDGSAILDNLVAVMPAGTHPTTLQRQGFLVGPSMYAGHVGDGAALPWDDCLHARESLLGPEGARTTITVAKDTDSDQRGATVIYRSGDAVPVAVVNGDDRCGSPGSRRYVLPTSSGGVTWTLVGPLDHRSSLMTGDDGDGSLDLVSVSARGRRTVGHLPAGSEVVAPGTTGGFFG